MCRVYASWILRVATQGKLTERYALFHLGLCCCQTFVDLRKRIQGYLMCDILALGRQRWRWQRWQALSQSRGLSKGCTCKGRKSEERERVEEVKKQGEMQRSRQKNRVTCTIPDQLPDFRQTAQSIRPLTHKEIVFSRVASGRTNKRNKEDRHVEDRRREGKKICC